MCHAGLKDEMTENYSFYLLQGMHINSLLFKSLQSGLWLFASLILERFLRLCISWQTL